MQAEICWIDWLIDVRSQIVNKKSYINKTLEDTENLGQLRSQVPPTRYSHTIHSQIYFVLVSSACFFSSVSSVAYIYCKEYKLYDARFLSVKAYQFVLLRLDLRDNESTMHRIQPVIDMTHLLS